MAQPSKSNLKSPSGGSQTWLLVTAIPVLAVLLAYFPNARDAIFGSSDPHPAVTIRQGTIVGKLLDDGKFPEPIEGFMGIPYALPPVNGRRFRPAEPVPDGNGTLEAFYMGPR